MRVARQLEHHRDRGPLHRCLRQGGTVPAVDNTVTGMYAAAKARRVTMCGHSRTLDDARRNRSARTGTLAILDHPKNPGYPTYWHARGYGLFAANPLGPSVLTDGKQAALNLMLQPRESATFRYRFLILEGTASSDRLEHEFTTFSAGQTSTR